MKISKNYLFNSRILILSLIYAFLLSACKKQDEWLDVKRNKSDVTPKTLQDFQSVLDNNQVMNGYSSILGLVGTDNIYIPDANLDATDQISRNAYLWSKDIYQGTSASDWFYAYQVVEYSNIVLDGLNNLISTDQPNIFNNIKGAALFYRSFAFYELSQLYCKQFVASTSGTDLGIPLRLSSDVNIKSVRATVQETYNQILNDLKEASSLLPQNPPYRTSPSSVAANALLAKVYLAMSDYQNALTYANLTLNAFPALLNYNSLTIGTSNPFPTMAKGHTEVIFNAWSLGNNTVYAASTTKARVAPALLQTYESGDLRKSAFFVADGTTGYYKFKGTYSANPYNFCGIASNEIYLIRAECLARSGNLNDALVNLNLLLKNRYTPATYIPVSGLNQEFLLNRIILERRKELPFTGNIRWEDLKRLNMKSNSQLNLIRTYRGVSYSLLANDPKYVLPLPDDEIQMNNLPQNVR